MDKRVVFIAVLLASLELSLVMSFPFPAKDLSKMRPKRGEVCLWLGVDCQTDSDCSSKCLESNYECH
ncbi:hypothetical protein ACROYT_G013712 [Oculina patagonica]